MKPTLHVSFTKDAWTQYIRKFQITYSLVAWEVFTRSKPSHWAFVLLESTLLS